MKSGKLYSSLTIAFIVIAVTFLSGSAIAQIPTVQDCLGAIPVCQDTYFQPVVYGGQGAYPNEINAGQTCPRSCMDGETNSIWYVISVKTGGLLRIAITPVVINDDYDWAVFNLNDYECSDIYENALLMQKSCNAAGGEGYHGTTGISTPSGGNANCNGGGPTNKWNADLPVQAGDTYVLCVSNWTPSSSAGYTLDFSASTADIFDDVPAFVTAIDTVKGCSGSATVNFDFNENILCNSVEASDFQVIGPDQTIYYPNSVSGAGCEAGGTQEKFFTLGNFYPPIIQSGIYTLTMVGDVEDLCTNINTAPPIEFYADMDPLPAITTQPEDDLVPIGAAANFSLETIGVHSYRWQTKQGMFWSDLTEAAPFSGTNTATLTINPATMGLGMTQYRCVVSGDCTPPAISNAVTLFVGDALAASATASPSEICFGQSSFLDVNAFGGNTVDPYTYLWSTPDGWTSDHENVSVEPLVTTTYTVTVNDGYNPITVNVTVIVNQLPIVSAGTDKTIFHGTQTQLAGSVEGMNDPNDYNWNWQPAELMWNNSWYNPITRKLTETSLFSVTVIDEKGCTSLADQVTVNILGGPLSANPTASPNVICLGDTAVLYALPSGGDTSNYSYSWSIGNQEISTEPTLTVKPSQTTTYTILLGDGSNDTTKTVQVQVNPLPVITLIKPEYNAPDNVIQVCVFDSLKLDSGFPNGEYFWSNGDTTFTTTIATSGISTDIQIHKVRVTNPVTNCINTDSVAVAFKFEECSYGIPEVSLNDLVKIFPNPARNSVTVSIAGEQDNYLIELSDLYGRLILKQEIQKTNSGIFNQTIDLSDIANEICFFRISSTKGSVVRKLVITH